MFPRLSRNLLRSAPQIKPYGSYRLIQRRTAGDMPFKRTDTADYLEMLDYLKKQNPTVGEADLQKFEDLYFAIPESRQSSLNVRGICDYASKKAWFNLLSKNNLAQLPIEETRDLFGFQVSRALFLEMLADYLSRQDRLYGNSEESTYLSDLAHQVGQAGTYKDLETLFTQFLDSEYSSPFFMEEYREVLEFMILGKVDKEQDTLDALWQYGLEHPKFPSTDTREYDSQKEDFQKLRGVFANLMHEAVHNPTLWTKKPDLPLDLPRKILQMNHESQLRTLIDKLQPIFNFKSYQFMRWDILLFGRHELEHLPPLFSQPELYREQFYRLLVNAKETGISYFCDPKLVSDYVKTINEYPSRTSFYPKRIEATQVEQEIEKALLGGRSREKFMAMTRCIQESFDFSSNPTIPNTGC